MMVDLGESEVFEGKALEPFARRLRSYRALANRLHQFAQLFGIHLGDP